MKKEIARMVNETGKKSVCQICQETVYENLGVHIREIHGEEVFHKIILSAKEHGVSDVDIGTLYGISFNTLERIITEAYGANISILKRPRQIKRWEPPNFVEEKTTVWSFKQRGAWATHDGRYRGNWSPYIPRNVILKYSNPGDLVLDYFVGGGTTAVEAKLLGRKCIATDINPGAVGLTLENLKFSQPRKLFSNRGLHLYEPIVSVGDARHLSDISDDSIDLICAHPPYAGIIRYGSNIAGDLSSLSVNDFLFEMNKVACESLRVLKPGGKCAILIGDSRKSKRVVPIGFQTIRVFLNAGFSLPELVIKRQHNCKTTGFWYARSIKSNFLLLAHEYLPIFKKPLRKAIHEEQLVWEYSIPYHSLNKKVRQIEKEILETTSVWIFPKDSLEGEIKRNLLNRFYIPENLFLNVLFDGDSIKLKTHSKVKPGLIYVALASKIDNDNDIAAYTSSIRKISKQAADVLISDGFLVIDTKDIRFGEIIRPMAMLIWEELSKSQEFSIKEVVIVLPKDPPREISSENLQIIHRYLLIFSKS